MTDAKAIETEYRGITLHYVKDIYGDRKTDLWETWGEPEMRGTLAECMEKLDAWELRKKIASGMKLWSLEHDNPKYWAQYDAIFKEGTSILFRNGTDPDRTYRRPMIDCALVTPETEKAIEAARVAFQEAIEAGERWKKARRSIVRITHADIAHLAQERTK